MRYFLGIVDILGPGFVIFLSTYDTSSYLISFYKISV